MQKQEMTFNEVHVWIYELPRPAFLFLQPVDEHDASLLDSEASWIEENTEQSFALAAFEVSDWNAALSPWEASAVFGKEKFAGRASDTLRFAADWTKLLRERFTEAKRIGIGGYSLAGLFALWAAYQTDLFSDVAAVSPSVWFPGWADYTAERAPMASRVYLSLGDREEKARNPVMATVGDRIREQYARLNDVPDIKACTLEWNEGNHFKDSDIRTAKGFVWLMGQQ